MKRLIKKILREEIDKSDKHYRMLDIISDHVQLPYFESMEGLTIYDKGDQEYIMGKILGNDIRFEYDVDDDIRFEYDVYDVQGVMVFEGDSGGYDDKGNMIYWEEEYDGYWEKREYDDDGNEIYRESSHGSWWKWEYDDKGNRIYFESSDGNWEKWEYDGNGNVIYNEDHHGDSFVWEYDENGNEIYFQNSDGYIRDHR